MPDAASRAGKARHRPQSGRESRWSPAMGDQRGRRLHGRAGTGGTPRCLAGGRRCGRSCSPPGSVSPPAVAVGRLAGASTGAGAAVRRTALRRAGSRGHPLPALAGRPRDPSPDRRRAQPARLRRPPAAHRVRAPDVHAGRRLGRLITDSPPIRPTARFTAGAATLDEPIARSSCGSAPGRHRGDARLHGDVARRPIPQRCSARGSRAAARCRSSSTRPRPRAGTPPATADVAGWSTRSAASPASPSRPRSGADLARGRDPPAGSCHERVARRTAAEPEQRRPVHRRPAAGARRELHRGGAPDPDPRARADDRHGNLRATPASSRDLAGWTARAVRYRTLTAGARSRRPPAPRPAPPPSAGSASRTCGRARRTRSA